MYDFQCDWKKSRILMYKFEIQTVRNMNLFRAHYSGTGGNSRWNLETKQPAYYGALGEFLDFSSALRFAFFASEALALEAFSTNPRSLNEEMKSN